MFRPFSLFYLHFVIPYYALMNESLFGGCINIPWTLLEIKPVLAPTSKMPYLMYIVTQNSGPSGFFLISLCLMSVHPQVRGSLTSSPDRLGVYISQTLYNAKLGKDDYGSIIRERDNDYN